MSCGSCVVQNAIDGVFLPRSPVLSRFWGSDLVLQCRTCFQELNALCTMLPRSWGVPTSFYLLIIMFLTNRGTKQYISPFNQIKSVIYIYVYLHMYNITNNNIYI